MKCSLKIQYFSLQKFVVIWKRIIIFEIFNISENNIIGVETAKVVVVVVVGYIVAS
jgi:hypothetical protein